MPLHDTNAPMGEQDAEMLAFRALGWTLSDDIRAERLLALTGLDPAGLRARAGDPALLAAVIDFLGGYEPDLEACASAIGVAPATLIAAGRSLAR